MKTKTKNIFKSALSLTLALIMVLGVAPLSELVGADWAGLFAPKAEAATSGIYTYEIANGKATITDCDTSASGAITIPSTLGGYPVTSIGYRAFESCDSLTSVTIRNSVTSIGNYAFYGCDNLISVTIPNSVTTIGDRAFEYCYSLTSVTIPNSVTSIGAYAFGNCESLTSVTIPNSVTTIGVETFRNCNSLTSVTIGNSVAFIGSWAFFSCDSLTNVTIPDSVTSIGNNAFAFCESLTSVTIGNSVTSIGDYAFEHCDGLTSVTIPDSVTSIGNYAFRDCYSLTSVTIGNSVASIGNWAFDGCTSLTSVTIGNSVTSIGDGAFNYCKSLTDIYYTGTEEEWKSISIGSSNEPLLNATIHYNQNVTDNIYNLGEETYSFKNFSDSDSEGGHCFGMSATSSAYYTGTLDISIISASNSRELYSLGATSVVKAPICHYQAIQGSFSERAIVAGGSYYKTEKYNINSDWNAVVNYVKNHTYDDKGSLQIGFRKDSEGGHSINFLRYSVVNGQERIYAYDNNFPNVETYFYKGSDGKVYQAPYSTFSGTIDCICLRNVATYMSIAGEYDAKRVIYADRDTILVKGAEAYPMDGDIEMGERVMYEIPAGVDEVTIVPLVDNAEFEYFGKEYAFEEINDETSGILKLATDDEGSASQEPSLTIINAHGKKRSIFAKILDVIKNVLLAPIKLIVNIVKLIIGLFK